MATPRDADCAMFYSITNCQEGLRGISFGNLLIKQVAEDLGREFPHLRRFATLSPIPGFRRWLGEAQRARAPERSLSRELEDPGLAPGRGARGAARRCCMRLCAHYLLARSRATSRSIRWRAFTWATAPRSSA